MQNSSVTLEFLQFEKSFSFDTILDKIVLSALIPSLFLNIHNYLMSSKQKLLFTFGN